MYVSYQSGLVPYGFYTADLFKEENNYPFRLLIRVARKYGMGRLPMCLAINLEHV